MRNPLKDISKLYLALIILIMALLVASLALSAKLLTSGHAEAEMARQDGRVVIVDLSNGSISGGISTAAPPAVAEAPQSVPEMASAGDVPPAAPVQVDPANPSAPPQGLALSQAPAESVTEQTELGPLPRISREGVKPWRFYGREPGEVSGPRVAVMLTGLGLSRSLTDEALRLPPEVSLSFSPYMADNTIWAGAARSWGHEIFVELPLEPNRYPAVDPGPKALMTGLQAQENNARLRWILTRFPGYAGVTLPPNEKFTGDKAAAEPVLQFLSVRGMMLVSEQAEPRKELEEMVAKLVLPMLRSQVAAHPDADEDTIRLQLLELENLARRSGSGLAVIPATPVAVRVVKQWVEAIKAKGYSVIPVSTLARSQFS